MGAAKRTLGGLLSIQHLRGAIGQKPRDGNVRGAVRKRPVRRGLVRPGLTPAFFIDATA